MVELDLIRTYIAVRNRMHEPEPPHFSRSLLMLLPGVAGDGASEVTQDIARQDDTADITMRLDATAEILKYRAEAPAFFVALRALSLLPEVQVVSIEQATRELLTTDFTLDEVSGAVRRLRASLSSMTTDHLAFVTLLHARGGLLAFLETFESLESFGSQSGLVTNQMQGREYESQVVTALVAAFRKLWRFTKRFQVGVAAAGHEAGAAAARFRNARELYAEIGTDKLDVAALIAKTADLASKVDTIKVSCWRGAVRALLARHDYSIARCRRSGLQSARTAAAAEQFLLVSMRTCRQHPS